MNLSLIALLKNEWVKVSRRKLPLFTLVAMGLLSVVVFYIGGQLSSAAAANGWGYVGFSMQILSNDLLPIFVLVFSAMLMSEETGSGTIRALLSAPVHRWEIYLAKSVAGWAYMAVLSAVALTCSLLLGGVHHSYGAVGDVAGTVYSRERAMQELLLAYLLSWGPLTALMTYGLMMSAFIRSPGAAVAATVSTFLIVDFTKHLVGIDTYVFTRYINYSWLVLQQMAQGMDFHWQPDVFGMVRLCGSSALVAFCAGLIRFVRQDLNH
jgi:ABC-type transport system involved in multi-copper enzyme maturation permease subunit